MAGNDFVRFVLSGVAPLDVLRCETFAAIIFYTRNSMEFAPTLVEWSTLQ
jgi:hypothetical protein